MTSRAGDPPKIYVPTLHSGLLRRAMPESVLFLEPGLPQTASLPGCFSPASYPFSREEARKVLAELLAIGESLDLAKPTGGQAARFTGTDASAALSEAERASLARFASSGDLAGAARTTVGQENPRIAAHKALLLAWDLEERLIGIEALRREVAEAARPLADALADPTGNQSPEQFFALPAIVAETLRALPDNALPDWRLNLAAMAPFLPENAILVTSSRAIGDALREAGMLSPLPQDDAFSPALRSTAPLWRVLGRSRAPEQLPWLLASPEIIVCPPGDAENGE